TNGLAYPIDTRPFDTLGAGTLRRRGSHDRSGIVTFGPAASRRRRMRARGSRTAGRSRDTPTLARPPRPTIGVCSTRAVGWPLTEGRTGRAKTGRERDPGTAREWILENHFDPNP